MLVVAAMFLTACCSASQLDSSRSMLADSTPRAVSDTTPRLIVDSTPRFVVDSIPRFALDTPITRRPRAIEYSDAYYKRLLIHRIGSYTMIPLFAAEYSLGQNLQNDLSPPSWMKPTHGLVAGGIAVLFGVNTITGAWNLWDSRQDPAGRTRRYVHTIMMLASDAGFLVTGAVAPGRQARFNTFSDFQNRVRVHRDWAIASISVATIGGGMMWFWKQ